MLHWPGTLRWHLHRYPPLFPALLEPWLRRGQRAAKPDCWLAGQGGIRHQISPIYPLRDYIGVLHLIPPCPTNQQQEAPQPTPRSRTELSAWDLMQSIAAWTKGADDFLGRSCSDGTIRHRPQKSTVSCCTLCAARLRSTAKKLDHFLTVAELREEGTQDPPTYIPFKGLRRVPHSLTLNPKP